MVAVRAAMGPMGQQRAAIELPWILFSHDRRQVVRAWQRNGRQLTQHSAATVYLDSPRCGRRCFQTSTGNLVHTHGTLCLARVAPSLAALAAGYALLAPWRTLTSFAFMLCSAGTSQTTGGFLCVNMVRYRTVRRCWYGCTSSLYAWFSPSTILRNRSALRHTTRPKPTSMRCATARTHLHGGLAARNARGRAARDTMLRWPGSPCVLS